MNISLYDHQVFMEYLIKNSFPNRNKYLEDLSLISGTTIDNIKSNSEPTDIEVKQILSLYFEEPLPKITCGILTFNEERCIERCIESIKLEVDEIIVIDSGSTDKTLNIIEEKFPDVKVRRTDWRRDFSYQRNIVLELATHEWVFFLDSDEYLHNEDKGKLRRLIKIASFENDKAYCISPLIQDTNSSYIYSETKRVFNIKTGIRYYGRIHEEPLLSDGTVPDHIISRIRILHDGYSEDILVQKQKFQRDISLIKEMLKEEPENPKWKFYYAREIQGKQSKTLTDQKNIFEFFKATIDSYENRKKDRFFQMALVLICKNCLESGNVKDLRKYLQILKEQVPNCADIGYFEATISLILYKLKAKKLIDDMKNEYIRNEQKVSYLHTSKSHLYYISALTLFHAGEVDQALELFDRIEPNTINTESMDFFSTISEKLSEYLESNRKTSN